MKIITTRGARFISSHFPEFLIKKGHKIIIIYNLSASRLRYIKNFKNRLKFIKADISKLGKWIESFNNAKIVFYLAALADIVQIFKIIKKL